MSVFEPFDQIIITIDLRTKKKQEIFDDASNCLQLHRHYLEMNPMTHSVDHVYFEGMEKMKDEHTAHPGS
ncbi:Hypothetical protein HVR_LOCUS919 [uncultured virus]|nr:Hypothetical protein HVR_LOCUS919 [uncultured virus]